MSGYIKTEQEVQDDFEVMQANLEVIGWMEEQRKLAVQKQRDIEVKEKEIAEYIKNCLFADLDGFRLGEGKYFRVEISGLWTVISLEEDKSNLEKITEAIKNMFPARLFNGVKHFEDDGVCGDGVIVSFTNVP